MLAVTGQVMLGKVIQLFQGRRFPRLPVTGQRISHCQLFECAFHYTLAYKAAVSGASCRQWGHRLKVAIEPHIPAFLIGAENRVWRTLAGVQGTRGHQHAVIKAGYLHPQRLQRLGHRPVPVQFVKRVLAATEETINPVLPHKVGHQRWHGGKVAGIQHMQIHTTVCQGFAQFKQTLQHIPATQRRHFMGVPLLLTQAVHRYQRFILLQRLL